MRQLSVTLIIDKDMKRKLAGYYMYRSREKENGRPVVDGMYIQKGELGDTPPETMSLHLEW